MTWLPSPKRTGSLVMITIMVLLIISGFVIIGNARKDGAAGASQGKAMNTAQEVRSKVSSQKIVIFAKTYCPWCQRVKKLFDDIKEPYLSVDMDALENGGQLQDELERQTGQRTVPNVFINGKHIGGCDTTEALQAKGELKKLLEEKFEMPKAEL